MRTELANRTVASGTNALSSSIVLVCRKRPEDAQGTTRRGFVNELRRELRVALKNLQSSNIAPVDLAQSAIGPGIGVFSKYKQVLEADGTPMTVRTALQIINQELDVFFNEQDGVLDRESRFCVDLFTQYAFNEMKFGEADTLARAKNTSVDTMKTEGILHAEKGIVRLLTRVEIPMDIRRRSCSTWLLMQQLTHALETKGIKECASYVNAVNASQAEYAKALAYRLYTVSERKGWNQEAFAYNNLVVAWPEIQSAAADILSAIPQQLSLFEDEGD
jgi:putative DNA methylase